MFPVIQLKCELLLKQLVKIRIKIPNTNYNWNQT